MWQNGYLQIVNMRLSFQACFIAISLVLTVNGDKSSPSCAKPYDKMMVCNLICNMIQDSDANNAMKMLQTKLESLIAVIKKPPPQPGTLLKEVLSIFDSTPLNKSFSNNQSFYIFLAAVPTSSCKQQFEKYK